MAADKPGLLEQVASLVADHGASWEESRLATLGGQFTGIVHISVPEKALTKLQTALQALEHDAFKITLQSEPGVANAPPANERMINVIGNDRPGILHELSRTLARYNINVEELNSELRSAPMSGQNLFAAEVKVSLPDQIDDDRFAQELDDIADELDVDIKLGQL